MPLKFPPYPGSILRCDFQGFKEPEMVKPRPVVIISTRPERINRRTCIIVPLSTSTPNPVAQYHVEITLPGLVLPKDIRRKCWVKGDMIYAVSLERLDLYRLEIDQNGKRTYYYDRIDSRLLFEIRKTVGHAIGLHLD
jgi:mRNA interferase MazF